MPFCSFQCFSCFSTFEDENATLVWRFQDAGSGQVQAQIVAIWVKAIEFWLIMMMIMMIRRIMMMMMMMMKKHLWSWSRVTRLMTSSQQGWSRSRLLSLVVRLLVLLVIIINIVIIIT